jgi:predicted protein tyrosine phosphatase
MPNLQVLGVVVFLLGNRGRVVVRKLSISRKSLETK